MWILSLGKEFSYPVNCSTTRPELLSEADPSSQPSETPDFIDNIQAISETGPAYSMRAKWSSEELHEPERKKVYQMVEAEEPQSALLGPFNFRTDTDHNVGLGVDKPHRTGVCTVHVVYIHGGAN